MESMVVEKVAPVLVPQPSSVTPRKRVRPYKARVSTKVKWALGDAMERTVALQRQLRKLLDLMGEAQQMKDGDLKWEAHLGRMNFRIAQIAVEAAELERTVTTAVAECKPAGKTAN